VNRPPVVVHPRPEPGRPGRVDMPRREPIRDHDRIMDPRRNGTVINHPRTFPDGRPINSRPVVRGPHGDHITIINNTTVINNVRNYNRWETDRNRYYWHDYNGHRFCHYYDSWGFHWYGWYIADVYFWTRYWNDMYWWYDPYYHRWVYLRDGRWWWQDPARVEVVYLYTPETNTYYQYDNAPGGGVVMTPDPTTPVETPPADPSEPSTTPAQQPQKIFMSADGRRSVQIFGEKNDAFLYDTAETPSFDPVYLASGVTEARFSQTAEDQPLTVLLLTEEKADDGTVTKGFKMFDENGNDLSQASEPTPAPVDAPSDNAETPAQTPSASQTLNLLRAGVNW
jgi:hypothetical protein